MASKQGVASLGPYIIRIQSGRLLASNDIASEVVNLALQPEGTLRSVVGPVALVDNQTVVQTLTTGAGTDNDPFVTTTVVTEPETVTRPHSSTFFPYQSVGPEIVYPHNMHGVFHATLQQGDRDVLLLHAGRELWEFTGWNGAWKRLIADTKPTFGIAAELLNTNQPQFPTQFEATGNGIVIVPQEGRAYYYDGFTIAPLGFSEVPGPPQPKGPSNSRITASDRGVGMNDEGYAHDGTPFDTTRNNYEVGMTKGFGGGRVGTISALTFDASVFNNGGNVADAYNAGWLQRGEYRCKTQYVDVFGNISAMSPPSSPLELAFQPSVIPKPGSGTEIVNGDLMRKQIAWTNINRGPDHCIGRNLYRTKDLIGSGDLKYYRHTQNTQGLLSDFATLPDNVTEVYPDNIPDSFLVREAIEVVPVPTFRLCRMCFGRLWIANMEGAPGMVRPSMPGRYGTFPAGQQIYPDPSGGEITGLCSANNGLLVFSRSSTFVITPSGDAFTSTVLSSQVGCEAPSSIATLTDGTVVWLGRDGFYAYDGSKISYISQDLREEFKKLTRARMKQAVGCYDVTTQEYRCWVSINGDKTNTLCFVYDGTGWRSRTDVVASSVCLTDDHRKYMIIAGQVGGETWTSNRDGRKGVYALDLAPNADDAELIGVIDKREAMLETSWMQANQSLERSTAKVVNLWLRETEDAQIEVEVLRDWRNTTIETAKTIKYSGADAPAFYNTTRLNTPGAKFVKRRPYWTRVQVYVSSSETFKFRIKGKGDWEFIGLQVEASPRNYGGAQVPP